MSRHMCMRASPVSPVPTVQTAKCSGMHLCTAACVLASVPATEGCGGAHVKRLSVCMRRQRMRQGGPRVGGVCAAAAGLGAQPCLSTRLCRPGSSAAAARQHGITVDHDGGCCGDTVDNHPRRQRGVWVSCRLGRAPALAAPQACAWHRSGCLRTSSVTPRCVVRGACLHGMP